MEKGNAQAREVEGRLTLEGLVLRVVLGADPGERLSARSVELDVSTAQPASGGDRLDYAQVVEEMQPLQGGAYSYVEDLASAAADLLLTRWPRRRWTVTVRKVRPPAALPLRRAVYTLVRGPSS
ncbi:MAG: dihydroneopterin aldolase [Candidatus Fermentibacteraceae bacterium]